MARGLGDDPLSRGKKAKRPAQSKGHGTASVSITAASGATGTNTTAAPGSYNDVFFQRRSEDVAEIQVAQPATTSEPAIIAPVPEIVAVEAAVPAAPAVVAEVPVQVTVPESAPVAAQEPQPPANQPVQETQKKGLFSRIFGSLRK